LAAENTYLKNQLSGFHMQGTSSLPGKSLSLGFLLVIGLVLIVSQTSFPEMVTKKPRSLLASSPELPEPIQNPINDQGSIVKYREWRIDQIAQDGFLENHEPCQKKSDFKSMTTVFCPIVQAYWEYKNSGLKHLQLILPINSLPMVENNTDENTVQDFMLEIMCVVTDINILPHN